MDHVLLEILSVVELVPVGADPGIQPGLGGTCIQAGYYPRKSTFKTHPKHIFSGMKIDPKYVFVHAFL